MEVALTKSDRLLENVMAILVRLGHIQKIRRLWLYQISNATETWRTPIIEE